MQFSERIFHKTFTASKSKDAYLMLCEWLARNVISKKDEIGEFTYEVEKVKDAEQPTFKLSLYASLNEKEVIDQHCRVCKEVHNLFYENSEYNCNLCREQAYRKRMQEKITVKAQHMKSVIRRKFGE